MEKEVIEVAQGPLAELGQQLKQAREQKQMTLQQVAATTKISRVILEGIEKGHIESNPGAVFVKGFIRTYAKLLGIAPEFVQPALDEVTARTQKPEHASNRHSDSKDTESASLGFKSLVATAALVLSALVYAIFQPTPEPNITVSETTPSVAASESVDSNTSPTINISSAETTSQRPLVLFVRAKANVWLHLKIDNAEPVEVFLEAGEEMTWEAQKDYEITVGNTSAIEMLVNSKAYSLDTEQDLISGLVLSRNHF